MGEDIDGVVQEVKKTNATWAAQLLVECPSCGEIIDLLKTEEWRDDWHYKFGALENRTGVNAEIECPKCRLLFVVEDTEW
jgi:phage FluMu protein Com